MPPAHAACLAMLAPVMTMREGARIYSPGGRLLEGRRPARAARARALEVVAQEGAHSFYKGTLADSLLALMEERGGLVTPDDLGDYRPVWLAPVETAYAGHVRADPRTSPTSWRPWAPYRRYGAARRLTGR